MAANRLAFEEEAAALDGDELSRAKQVYNDLRRDRLVVRGGGGITMTIIPWRGVGRRVSAPRERAAEARARGVKTEEHPK